MLLLDVAAISALEAEEILKLQSIKMKIECLFRQPLAVTPFREVSEWNHHMTVELCGYNGCRKERGHEGSHDQHPSQAWAFLTSADKNKITKAGFATPRGGQKGAYQNHVLRSNKVIIPYEHLEAVPLDDFENGYVVRLFPEQYFRTAGKVRKALKKHGAPVVGKDAFILYRTHSQFGELPPLEDWELRWLELEGERVSTRKPGAVDHGEYVVRIAAHGSKPQRIEGPPQGIFAPEYANAEANFVAKCVLAWLIVHTVDGPYVAAQAELLKAILQAEGLFDEAEWGRLGLVRRVILLVPFAWVSSATKSFTGRWNSGMRIHC